MIREVRTFSCYGGKMPDSPDDVYRYSDFRTVDGVEMPMRIDAFRLGGDRANIAVTKIDERSIRLNIDVTKNLEIQVPDGYSISNAITGEYIKGDNQDALLAALSERLGNGARSGTSGPINNTDLEQPIATVRSDPASGGRWGVYISIFVVSLGLLLGARLYKRRSLVLLVLCCTVAIAGCDQMQNPSAPTVSERKLATGSTPSTQETPGLIAQFQLPVEMKFNSSESAIQKSISLKYQVKSGEGCVVLASNVLSASCGCTQIKWDREGEFDDGETAELLVSVRKPDGAAVTDIQLVVPFKNLAGEVIGEGLVHLVTKSEHNWSLAFPREVLSVEIGRKIKHTLRITQAPSQAPSQEPPEICFPQKQFFVTSLEQLASKKQHWDLEIESRKFATDSNLPSFKSVEIANGIDFASSVLPVGRWESRDQVLGAIQCCYSSRLRSWTSN
jgi:hypothetical protein